MIKETNGPEETFAFGKMLGEQAKPGEVICLNGDLGVGKTVFTCSGRISSIMLDHSMSVTPSP